VSGLRTRRYGERDRAGLDLEQGSRGSKSSGVSAGLPATVSERRPRTRGECPTTRPCPWAGCRYHLALEVSTDGRTVRVREGWEEHLSDTCALDVADRGATPLHDIDAVLGLQWGDSQRAFDRVAGRLRRALGAHK
jgi:hypothetical protein